MDAMRKAGAKSGIEMERSIDSEIALGVFEPATTQLARKMVKSGMTICVKNQI